MSSKARRVSAAAVLAGAWCLAGCTTPYDITIISDPPGARIEVNEDFLGLAPVHFKAEGDWMVRVFERPNVIRALPIKGEGSGFIQEKWFPRHSYIPNTILFDMSLSPPDNTVRISLDQKVEVDQHITVDEAPQGSPE